MSLNYPSGRVDLSVDVQIVDDSGLPVTGLVASTFPAVSRSSGSGDDVSISLSDLAALTTPHADGGVKERGGGFYRLDVPDLADGTHTLRAEASNKRLIAPKIQVGTGASGAGARTVTFTVDDGSNPLQNAVVRVIQGAENYASLTNASGVAVFALDDATWSYAVTKPGYDGETGSLVVNGTEALTVSLDAVVVTPPASPSLSAIEVLCLDASGQVEVGVDVDIRMVSIPSGSQNIAFKGAKQTATSDANGIARLEVVQGSTCEWKRGAADAWQRISVDADGVTNVTSVIGSP